MFIENVFSVSLSSFVDSQVMGFSCNSEFTVLSIPGRSDWVSSVDCTWLICI